MLEPMKFGVEINKLFPGEKLPPGDPPWTSFTRSFLTHQLTVDQLVEAILQRLTRNQVGQPESTDPPKPLAPGHSELELAQRSHQDRQPETPAAPIRGSR